MTEPWVAQQLAAVDTLATGGGGGNRTSASWADVVEKRVTFQAQRALSNARVGVLAAGGLGRRALCAHADVDLIFVHQGRHDDEAAIQELVTVLWDDGLRLAHRALNTDELVEACLSSVHDATILLEARSIGGDQQLAVSALRAAYTEAVLRRRRTVLLAKLDELSKRWQKFDGAIQLVEPDVKNAPGGIRDQHALCWIALLLTPRPAARVDEPVDAVGHLLRDGVLFEREARHLKNTMDTLSAVRFALHLEAGRAQDRLVYELQGAVARRLQLTDDDVETGEEALMRIYYGAARKSHSTVAEALDRLLSDDADAASAIFVDVRRPAPRRARRPGYWPAKTLESGFRERSGRLFVDDPSLLDRAPHRAVDAYRILSERQLRLSPSTLQRLHAVFDGPPRSTLFDDEEVGAALFTLCQSKTCTRPVFQRLLGVGVMTTLLRDMARLHDAFKHDGYHAFTTDAHLCRAADFALLAASGTLAPPAPLVGSLRRTTRFHLLVMAALLHDIGKGLSGDHSDLGADIARREAHRFGLAEGEIEVLAFLVEEHLLLSRVSQRRDLSDPAVVEDVASRVRTVERLDLLALLTWVDMAAVSPDCLTDWKVRLLGTAVDRVAAFLRQPDGGGRLVEEDDRRARQIAFDDVADELSSPVARRFVDGSTARTLVGRRGDDRRRDASTFAKFVEGHEDAFVDVRETVGGFAHEIRICCAHRASWVARIARAVAMQGGNVLAAHVESRTDGVGLLTLRVDNGKGRRLHDSSVPFLRDAILDALDDKMEQQQHLRGTRTGRGLRIPPSVRVLDERDTWGATIVEVAAHDRLGLLAQIVDVFDDEGWQLLSAKISTDGARVRDTFYVEPPDDGDGRLLTERLRGVLGDVTYLPH